MWRLRRSGPRMESRYVRCEVEVGVRYTDVMMMQNKQLEVVKNGSRGSSAQTSRAVSVSSNGTGSKAKAKGKKK